MEEKSGNKETMWKEPVNFPNIGKIDIIITKVFNYDETLKLLWM